jgi:hypothetical protein
VRLGGLVGRLHAVGERGQAEHRLVCTPQASTSDFLRELESAGVVPAKHAAEFSAWPGSPGRHRAAVRRKASGLRWPGLLLMFDDMMRGPAVQDLWLLLPDRVPCAASSSWRATRPSTPSRITLGLIEPLRRCAWCTTWPGQPASATTCASGSQSGLGRRGLEQGDRGPARPAGRGSSRQYSRSTKGTAPLEP